MLCNLLGVKKKISLPGMFGGCVAANMFCYGLMPLLKFGLYCLTILTSMAHPTCISIQIGIMFQFGSAGTQFTINFLSCYGLCAAVNCRKVVAIALLLFGREQIKYRPEQKPYPGLYQEPSQSLYSYKFKVPLAPRK